MLIIFDMKATVYREFILADETVNSSHYCDILRRLHENMEDFTRNFGNKKLPIAPRQHTVSRFLFRQGMFDQ